VRQLDEDAGAVTGVDLRSGGAAVVEVAQHLQAVRDHLVRLAAVHIDDEADAAGLVFEPRIVEALFGRQTWSTARQGTGWRLIAGGGSRVGLRMHVHEVGKWRGSKSGGGRKMAS